MRGIWLVVALCGCIEPQLVPCGDLLCPVGTTCDPVHGCVQPDQLIACSGKQDGDACTSNTVPRGYCSNGFCLDVVCGDGITQLDEVCDDGNTSLGDGCSARCDSNETCGNQIADVEVGEQCDRGVPNLSNDGCSSTCVGEVDLWRSATPVDLDTRYNAAVAYDTKRGEIVVFGGVQGTPGLQSVFNDTWTFRDGAWTKRTTPVAPRARFGATFTYDPVHERAILFGGEDLATSGASITLGDTWAWDGLAWTQLTPSTSPNPRRTPASTWDDGNKEIVLFSGDFTADTWTWNGTTWTLEQPPTSPAAHSNHSMTYDAVHGYVMLYGGYDHSTGNPSAETWTWNGTTWTRRTTVDHPRGRVNVSLAYHAARGFPIAFGGSDGNFNEFRDTWRWNGTNWVEMTAITTDPPARASASAAYDVGRSAMVIVGGDPDATTWELALDPAWSPIVPLTPSGSERGPLVYDPLRGRILMVGFGATWEWDGAVWTRRMLCSIFLCPDPRAAFAYDPGHRTIVATDGTTRLWDGTTWVEQMVDPQPSLSAMQAVYDPARSRVILVGSATTGVAVWEWDGGAWQEMPASNGPSSRQGFGLAYDRAHSRTLLFGGELADHTLLGDTWAWDGATWTELHPATVPRARRGPAMAAHDLRGSVYLIGGDSADGVLDDTWEWTDDNWERRALFGSDLPPPRYAAHAAFDAGRGRLVLFGGLVLNFRNDTWTYGFESIDGVHESCVDGEDLDRDGRAGCDDPDCSARCWPLCAPGSACDPTTPHCGDGECSIIEDYLVCPADCML